MPLQPPHDASSLDSPVPLVVADDRFLTFQALVNVIYRHRLLVFYRFVRACFVCLFVRGCICLFECHENE